MVGWLATGLGVIAGGAAGYGVYLLVTCPGLCRLVLSPLWHIVLGAWLGLLAVRAGIEWHASRRERNGRSAR